MAYRTTCCDSGGRGLGVEKCGKVGGEEGGGASDRVGGRGGTVGGGGSVGEGGKGGRGVDYAVLPLHPYPPYAISTSALTIPYTPT